MWTALLGIYMAVAVGTVRHCVPSSQIPRVFTMSQGAPRGGTP